MSSLPTSLSPSHVLSLCDFMYHLYCTRFIIHDLGRAPDQGHNGGAHGGPNTEVLSQIVRIRTNLNSPIIAQKIASLVLGTAARWPRRHCPLSAAGLTD